MTLKDKVIAFFIILFICVGIISLPVAHATFSNNVEGTRHLFLSNNPQSDTAYIPLWSEIYTPNPPQTNETILFMVKVKLNDCQRIKYYCW